MDLGECPKVHDLALRADYEIATKQKDTYYYDIDAMEHLESFIKDCDRKTELAKRRLKETQEELSEEANDKADAIHGLGEQIGTQLAKAEEEGAQGNVDESLKLMAEVEELNRVKSMAETEFRNSMPASRHQQQKLRVCEVCSALLGIHDNDRQLADHFGGKLHLGFIEIRNKLAELKKSVQDRKEQRDKEREERNRDRGKRERSRSGSRRRHRSRSRQRSHSRQRRSRSRDRRRRSKDRSRRRRSTSRSRRSRSRSHSRKHSRRSRSHSRRSRSKSRSRRERRKQSSIEGDDRSPGAENGDSRRRHSSEHE